MSSNPYMVQDTSALFPSLLGRKPVPYIDNNQWDLIAPREKKELTKLARVITLNGPQTDRGVIGWFEEDVPGNIVFPTKTTTDDDIKKWWDKQCNPDTRKMMWKYMREEMGDGPNLNTGLPPSQQYVEQERGMYSTGSHGALDPHYRRMHGTA
jgi:hypothetical protein